METYGKTIGNAWDKQKHGKNWDMGHIWEKCWLNRIEKDLMVISELKQEKWGNSWDIALK